MARDPAPKKARRNVRVGKYEVVSHIATGGMGAVYKAVDTDLKRLVALKVLNPDLAAKPAALERFRREARHAAKLRHENIVSIYEFGNDGATWFLALEFVDGIDLQEYITRKGRLDPEEARQVALQAVRALHHAHKHGIVHRDIKPSNFLVCRKGDKLFVKMSDFGLAREMTDEEARVTRDGTTVGTVDYMAPEQARDSGKADIRSDIYALGCTLFHMLAGRPPFQGGGIGERLYKHISEDPPDLRELNPRVSASFVAVVNRMLAKKPQERYQTPKDLLRDLQQVDAVGTGAGERDFLAGLALADKEVAEKTPARRKRPSSATRPTVTVPKRPDVADEPSADSEGVSVSRRVLVLGAGGAAALLVVVVGVIVLAFGGRQRPSGDDANGIVGPAPPALELTSPRETTAPVAPPVPAKPSGGILVNKPLWPALADGAPPVDADALWQEYLAAWAKDVPPPPDTPVHRVARMSAGGPRDFGTLEAACAAAPAGRTTVVEIHDNGPLFVRPIAVGGRGLVLRAGKGYRPLIAWDVAAPRDVEDKERSFLLVQPGGSLTLEGLDMAVRWTDAAAAGRVALARVTDGDFLARDCTFSAAGKHAGGIVAVRFERGETPAGAPAPRCRLSRCCARGTNLVALDLDAPGAEVLLDGCLAVGGEQPLLRVTGRSRTPTTVRVVRSTLVAARAVLRLTPATRDDFLPRLHWHAWDALLTRSGGQPSGGEMFVVADGGQIGQVLMRPTNCLYAGWQALLRSADTSAADQRGWQVAWRLHGGDAARPEPWPAALPNDLAELAPEACRPEPASPVGFAATSGPGPLGCDLAALPPARDNWLALTGDEFAPPPVALPGALDVPEVPAPGDGRYHGGLVDLARTDLGAFLDEAKKRPGLGPRVVLHLSGSGTFKTKAIRIKGASLVLYFLPPEEGMPPPALAPHDNLPQEGDALIEVEDGNLELLGAEVRCPDYRLAVLPRYLVKVRGGDLRLLNGRLHGPRLQAPDAFRAAVAFEGGGGADTLRTCDIDESVLVSGKSALHVTGSGARVRLRQSVAVCGGEAIFYEPGPAARPRLATTFALEHTTVAARRAVARVADAPNLGVPAEPAVVLAHDSAFLNPFADAGPAPTLLAFEGNALARGLLVWQGEHSVYDKRLGRDVGVAAGAAVRPHAGLSWARLGGPAWESRQLLDLSLTRAYDWRKEAFDALALPPLKPPPGETKKVAPGADLESLRLLKPPEKPRKPR